MPGGGQMLGFVVDRSQHCLGRAAQHPQPRDAGTGTDLDNGPRRGRRGEEGILRTDNGTDRCGAQLDSVGAGARDRAGFAGRLADESGVRVVIAHDVLLRECGVFPD